MKSDWDLREISRCVQMLDIKQYTMLPWDRTWISSNPHITVESILSLKIKGQWDWSSLSESIDIDEVREHPYLPWRRDYLSRNPGIRIDVLRDLPLSYSTGQWDWYELSRAINMDDVRQHRHYPWNRYGLSQNRGIRYSDLSLVMPNAVGGWNYKYLSSCIDLKSIPTRQFIYNLLPSKWHKRYMSLNPSLCVQMIRSSSIGHLKGRWNWQEISRNINIYEVYRYPHLPWSREGLSCNRCISLDLIDNLYMPDATGDWKWNKISMYIQLKEVMTHPYRPWNKHGLSCNKEISLEFVSAYAHGNLEYLLYKTYPKMEYKQSYLCDIDIVCLY